MLIIYRYLIPFPLTGAHGIQIAHTCHALARAGADVMLYPAKFTQPTPEKCLAYYGLAPHPNLKLCLSPQITQRSRRWRGPLARFWENWHFAGLKKREPVFVLRDGEDSYTYIRRLSEKRAAWRCRTLLEVHRLHSIELEEYSKADAPEADRQLVGNSLRRRAELEGDALKFADGLLPIGATLLRAAQERFGELPPAEILPSGTPPPPQEVNPIAARSGVVYVGQLYPWKGTDVLIEAMGHVDTRLTVVGGDREAGFVAAKELAGRLGVDGRVEFLGHKPHAEAMTYLGKGRCTVVALSNHVMSRLFTSPVKLFEAMAAGTPVVATDLPTTREILRHEHNALLVPPGDAVAMAQAVRRLLGDDALAVRLQQQALHDVRQYTYDARAAKIIAFAERTRASAC